MIPKELKQVWDESYSQRAWLRGLQDYYYPTETVICQLILALIVLLQLIRYLRPSPRNRFQLFTDYHSPIIDQTNQHSLRSIIHKHCPSLVGPRAYFAPTPWLFRYA